MNAIQILSSEAWVARLGWTLVHFLWQGLLIAILYAIARRLSGDASSPRARYVLACAALAVMTAAPLVTWSLMYEPDTSPGPAYRIRGTPPTAVPGGGTITLPVSVHATVSAMRAEEFLPWVVIVWLF